MYWSDVSTASNDSAAWRRSAPLLRPVHPSCVTVWTSRPASSRDSGRGRDSSSRMRTGGQQILGNFQGRNRLFACHGGKIVEELLEAVTRSEVVEKILHRDPCADKHGRATENLRVALYNRFESGHTGLQLTD